MGEVTKAAREAQAFEHSVMVVAQTALWDVIGKHDLAELIALEDAMSREAQAERERRSRIIPGTAETEIASKFRRSRREIP